MPSIERELGVKGKHVPGFVRNAGVNFFCGVYVFEDGLIDCWDVITLSHLKDKIRSSELVSSVKKGEVISIHNLGDWTVKKARWLLNKKQYLEFIENVVRSLNPQMKFKSPSKEYIKLGDNTFSYYKVGTTKACRSQSKAYSKIVYGKSYNVLLNKGYRRYLLIQARIHSDATVELFDKESSHIVSLGEFKQMFLAGDLCVRLEDNSTVQIPLLGEIVVDGPAYTIDINELIREFDDTVLELNGENTTSKICAEVYKNYISNPRSKGRSELKSAYLNVPEHRRRYILGDMDIKDYPIKKIIYNE